MIKKVRIVIYIILGLVLLINLGTRLYNNYQIEHLDYGVEANVLRSQLNIPLIDKDMEALHRFDEFVGNKWEADETIPVHSNEVLHIWKTVVPGESTVLKQETDAFRRKKSDSTLQQLNINTTIFNDSEVKQTGLLFQISSKTEAKLLGDRKLSAEELRSVKLEWGIN